MIKWTPKVGQKILCTNGAAPSVFTAGKRYEVVLKEDGLRVLDNRSSVWWIGPAEEYFQDSQDIEDSKYVPQSELKLENKAMFTKGQWVICNEGHVGGFTFPLVKDSVHKVGNTYPNGNMEVYHNGNSVRRCGEQRRFSLLVSTLPVIHALTNARFLAIGPKGAVEFVRKPHESVWDSGMAALKAFEAPAMPEVKGTELTLAIEVAKSIGQERRAKYSKKDGTKRDCKIKVTSIDGTKVYFVHVEGAGIRQVDVSQIEAFETKDGKLMVR